MKHSYQADCDCGRCQKERQRRTQQGRSEDARQTIHRAIVAAERRHTRRTRRSSRRPIVGSAEWAETRGDDIPSYDQPGDDFDTY